MDGGQAYSVVYDKKTKTLHITRNLRAMKENMHLISLERQLDVETVNNMIIYVPPGPTPFTMGRVTKLEYIDS